jgi:tRNA nucleotidyltransferase/poly(A) polymerase
MSEHLIKLQEALAEVTQARAEVENKSDVAAIDELVAEYRAKITAEFAEKKAQDLAEKDFTIKVINGLIAKAEAAQAVEQEEVVDATKLAEV